MNARKKKRIYLAHPISTKGEYEDSKRLANELRSIGYEVYAAAENDYINDKTNEPTPLDIYYGDVSEIIGCDIFVMNLTGGLQDGTISELGFVAGFNEGRPHVSIPIIGYTSNARLLDPQFSDGIPSASANHLVKGMVDRWGEFVGHEGQLLDRLSEDTDEKECIDYIQLSYE